MAFSEGWGCVLWILVKNAYGSPTWRRGSRQINDTQTACKWSRCCGGLSSKSGEAVSTGRPRRGVNKGAHMWQHLTCPSQWSPMETHPKMQWNPMRIQNNLLVLYVGQQNQCLCHCNFCFVFHTSASRNHTCQRKVLAGNSISLFYSLQETENQSTSNRVRE